LFWCLRLAAPSTSIVLRQLIQGLDFGEHITSLRDMSAPQTPQALRAGSLRCLLDQLFCDN